MSESEHLREAVAVAYSDAEGTPHVVAKGRGLIAEEIISRAKAHGIYVHESPVLLSLLMRVDLDARIPEALYAGVAELLCWIYRMEKRKTPPSR